MDKKKQAQIILEELNEQYMIPSYMEEYALKGIIAGLKRIEEEEPNQRNQEHPGLSKEKYESIYRERLAYYKSEDVSTEEKLIWTIQRMEKEREKLSGMVLLMWMSGVMEFEEYSKQKDRIFRDFCGEALYGATVISHDTLSRHDDRMQGITFNTLLSGGGGKNADITRDIEPIERTAGEI